MLIKNVVLYGAQNAVIVNLKYDNDVECHNAMVSLEQIENIKLLDSVKKTGTFTIAYDDGTSFTYPATSNDEIILSLIADANENGCRNRIANKKLKNFINSENLPDLNEVIQLCKICFDDTFQEDVAIVGNYKYFDRGDGKLITTTEELPVELKALDFIRTPEVKQSYLDSLQPQRLVSR